MGVRDERREQRDREVLAAAGKLFSARGYAGATIPRIAAEAGVAVGTVAKVGTKDELFLQSIEEMSTDASLAIIERARDLPSVTERVWAYFEELLAVGESMPETMRDYFAAYVRGAEHTENVERLHRVHAALRTLFPADDLGQQSPARLTAVTLWLAYTALAYGLAARTYVPEAARDLMRSIVEQQCAPFESREIR